jgi:hypothetical protein
LESSFGTRSKTEIPTSRHTYNTPSPARYYGDKYSEAIQRKKTSAFPIKNTANSKKNSLPTYNDNLDMREPPSAVTANTSTVSKINSGIQQQYLNSQQAPPQNTRGGFPPPQTGGTHHKQGSGQNQFQGGQQPPNIPQLQDMARRQQQQIEAQQQLLVAKEQRLKYLRQQDYRHHQMAAEYERLRRLREKVSYLAICFLYNKTKFDKGN